jgi:hypothetical protein
MWFEALLKVLGAGLELWASAEKRKYIDRKIALEKAFYEEYNKPIGVRSDAALDDLEFQLRILCSAFVADSGKPNTTNKP